MLLSKPSVTTGTISDYESNDKQTEFGPPQQRRESSVAKQNNPPYRLLLIAGILAILLLFSLRGWQVYLAAEEQAMAEGRDLAEETLVLQIELLSGVLEKYRMLPPLMARQPKIHALFKQAIGRDLAHNNKEKRLYYADFPVDGLRAELLELVHLSGAKDVAFYGFDGQLLISGRHLFRGNLTNFAESLVSGPIQGRLGRALVKSNAGVVSYAFSSAVKSAGELLGIIVFFVDLEPIEQTWALSRLPITVFDDSNIIVLSNRQDFLGKNQESIRQLRNERVFYRVGKKWQRRVVATREIPRLNWRMEVISELPGLKERRQSALLSTLIVALIVATIYIFAVKKRQSQFLANRRIQENAVRLERLVDQRTRALSDTNLNLQQEVEERKQAEAKLVTTQKELVHAAKLAVIGQMSTTLSHEFNQPLAAVRTYAENAEKLQTMEKYDAVAENLSRIITQVDRMGDLSKTLMSFARKPDTKMIPLKIRLCLDEAFMLVSPRAKKLNVRLEDHADCADIWVLGVQVQIIQVMVNILSNAIDAVSGIGQADSQPKPEPQGRVQVNCEQSNGIATITIHDNGPGVPVQRRETIFEPFYTTKQSGLGLGIGLSVVSGILKDMQGSIAIDSSPLGGALVRVSLLATEEKSPAPLG